MQLRLLERGDEVLACFGYPAVREDDSEHAVQAALALAGELPAALQRKLPRLALGVLAVKVGLTVSASIPAAVVSMAVLRLFRQSNILENNIVQTSGSAGESRVIPRLAPSSRAIQGSERPAS